VAGTADRPGGYTVATGGPCKGMLEIRAVPGACTHGPDAPMPGYDVKRPVPPEYPAGGPRATSVVCDGDGTSGYRVQVLYVRGRGKPSRCDEYLASFRGWASEVDGIYDTSAKQTGGTRHVRYVTGAGCEVTVTEVAIDDGRLADFGESVDAIQEQGFDRTDRKYLMFVDTDALCGVAFVVVDSSPGQDNSNNSGPSFARVDNGCWDAPPAAHELTHALGLGQRRLAQPHRVRPLHRRLRPDVLRRRPGHPDADRLPGRAAGQPPRLQQGRLFQYEPEAGLVPRQALEHGEQPVPHHPFLNDLDWLRWL
jgi:hypothetical protein